MGFKNMSRRCAFPVLLVLGTYGLITSILFQLDSDKLLNQYQNMSSVFRTRRGHCLLNCSTVEKRFPCEKGPELCFQNESNVQAISIDYNQLLRNKLYETNQYNFSIPEDKLLSLYPGSVKDKAVKEMVKIWEDYLEKREEVLHSYPSSWKVLAWFGIVVASLQCLGIVVFGFVPKVKNESKLRFLIIGFSGLLFLISISLFITALVWRADYSCPKLEYLYFGIFSSSCTGNETYGKHYCAYLGLLMIITLLMSIGTWKLDKSKSLGPAEEIESPANSNTNELSLIQQGLKKCCIDCIAFCI